MTLDTIANLIALDRCTGYLLCFSPPHLSFCSTSNSCLLLPTPLLLRCTTLPIIIITITVHTLRKPNPLPYPPHKRIPLIHHPTMPPNNHLIKLANLLRNLDFLGYLVVYLIVPVLYKVTVIAIVVGIMRGRDVGICTLGRHAIGNVQHGAGVVRWKREGGAVEMATAEGSVRCVCLDQLLSFPILSYSFVSNTPF